MADEKTLRILIDMETSGDGAQKASQSLDKIRSSAKHANDETKNTASGFQQIEKASGSLNSIGVRLTAAGAALGGPILAATKQYISSVGMGDSTSRKWLSTTQQMQYSYEKLGKVGAQVILPWLQQDATLT